MSLQPVYEAAARADVAVETSELARKAHQLRVQGKSWWVIAEELGLTERRAATLVAQAIDLAAELVVQHNRESMLSLELDRLDELQAAHWGRATTSWTRQQVVKSGDGFEVIDVEEPPDTKAAETVLKIMAQRQKLTKLDTPTEDANGPVRTVIVAGTGPEYIAALQRVVQGQVIPGITNSEEAERESA